MMNIKGVNIKNFSKSEFPEDPEECAEVRLLLRLDKFRDILGEPIYPSPVKGALARDNPRSQHHYDPDKGIKSKAVDCFCAAKPLKVYSLALVSQLFGGIGVYPDGYFKEQRWTRFHFDIRRLGTNHIHQTTLVWYQSENGMVYPEYENSWDLLFRILDSD